MVDIDSFLTKDERINQMKTQIEGPEIAIEAATLLIQNRVLYPVQLLANANADDRAVRIAPVSVELQKSDRIKFPDKTLEVNSGIQPTPLDIDEQALPVLACPGHIKAGSIGHLMRGGEYLQGDPTWSIDDTRKIGQKLVAAIYEFYKKEKSNAPSDESEEAPVGNDPNLLSESEQDPQ